MYKLPSQTNFLEILNIIFEKTDIDEKEMYILSNFNINTYYNNRYIVRDDNTISAKFPSQNYNRFCIMLGLKQLMQSPIHITLIDPILKSVLSIVFQNGVINVGVSDHQLIFCIKKISRIKTGCTHKYLNFS